jgi:thiol-disulfide isomerase/thioredoxin
VEVAAAPVGQYRMRAVQEPGRWADFIWPDPSTGDSILNFELDFKTLDGGAARVTGSRDNDAYQAVRQAHARLLAVRAQQSDPQAANIALAEFNRDCRALARRYAGTFTADIVCSLLIEPRPADYAADPKAEGLHGAAFSAAYALDKIPFGSAGVLRHSGLAQALTRYYSYWSAEAEGGKKYVEGVMSRRRGNEEVDGFLFNFLLARVLDFNDENGLTYLLANYPPDCSDESPLPDATKNMVQALQACQPGREAPALQLPAADGRPVDLAGITSRHDLTLLFLWRTTCQHCEELRPLLLDLYERYRSKGLEIVAISLDPAEADWKSYLKAHPSPWVDLFVPPARREAFSRQIPVPGTPALISLDRQHRVLSRLVARQTLEGYLKEALK